MRSVVCDKCGKEMKQFGSVRFPYLKVEKCYLMGITTYDLCYDCQQKLEQWLKKEEGDE